ncbi:hypothetical protein ACHQM5_018800 [Ranunculus cassubicifolius]
MSVSTYFSKLKSLWNELNSLVIVKPCSCGNGKAIAERLMQDRAMEFLQGLHERYAALRSQILLMEPFPNTGKIYSLVRQEEKQQEIQSALVPTPDAAALLTRNPNRGTSSYRGSSSKGKSRFHCENCGRDNHTIDRCYKIIDYPPKKSQVSNVSKQEERAMNIAVTSPIITQEQYTRLMDMLSPGSNNPNAHLAGPINEADDWTGPYP